MDLKHDAMAPGKPPPGLRCQRKEAGRERTVAMRERGGGGWWVQGVVNRTPGPGHGDGMCLAADPPSFDPMRDAARDRGPSDETALEGGDAMGPKGYRICWLGNDEDRMRRLFCDGTGKLGEVMQESAQAALSYARFHSDDYKPG